jgi:hypothetical protein
MNDLNDSLVNVLSEQKEKLKEQLIDCKKEQDRLRYIATGLAALIGETKDEKIIHRAKEITDEADKLN